MSTAYWNLSDYNTEITVCSGFLDRAEVAALCKQWMLAVSLRIWSAMDARASQNAAEKRSAKEFIFVATNAALPRRRSLFKIRARPPPEVQQEPHLFKLLEKVVRKSC